MRGKRFGMVLFLATALALAACSDDDGGGPVGKQDQGGGKKLDGQAPTPDLPPPAPDMGTPKVCELKCMQKYPYYCVYKKGSTITCVQCNEDKHCKNNPGSFGVKCNKTTNKCSCAKDMDCGGKIHGKRCNQKQKICSCTADADCVKGYVCTGTYGYGTTAVKVCKQKCQTDKDCTSSSASKCDGTTGKCVACFKNSDCTSAYASKCDTKTRKCVKCTKNEECKHYPFGGFCDTKAGKCGCSVDGNCKGGYYWGNKCTGKTSTLLGQCKCSKDADCAGNPNGPTCYTTFSKCTCKTDADCKNAAYPKCALPYSSASYKHCQKGCKTDSDCKVSGLPKCSPGGKCVACFKDGDCTSKTYKYCTAGQCVKCKTNADCSGSTTYKYCLASKGSCVKCLQNSHCTGTSPICDSSTGSCVSCKADGDCKKGYQWGNKCIKSSYSAKCGCKANGDCSGNPNGPTCYTTYDKCTCKTDGDCKKAPYTKCALPYSSSSYSHCQKPCTKDADCPSTTLKCIKATGKCAQCAVDKDCTSTYYKYCRAGTGKCVQCKSDKDCTSSTSPKCDTSTGSCVSCKNDADCKAGYQWGNKCIKGTSSASCGCTSNAQCAGNPNGPTCYTTYKKCSCKTNADCKKAPYTLCAVPYSGASYKHCQKKCTKDADCTSSLYSKCKVNTGACVACLKNADCTSATSPVCDTSTNKCVSCKSNADCKTNINGGKCVSGSCKCTTDADCKTGYAWGDTCDSSYGRCACKATSGCAKNVNGPTCYSTYKKCSCKTNADCKTAPYKTCKVPYSGATYKHCQK